VPLSSASLRGAASAVLLGAALLGCSSAPAAPPLTTLPFEASGEGPGGSTSINLAPGSYAIVWSAAPTGKKPCTHRAAFETTNELVIKPLMNTKVRKAITDARIVLSDTSAGTYYIDINSDCRWTFRLVQEG
jgi:hypothetical protein